MTLNQAVVHHHVEGEEKLWIKSIIIRIVFIFFFPLLKVETFPFSHSSTATCIKPQKYMMLTQLDIIVFLLTSRKVKLSLCQRRNGRWEKQYIGFLSWCTVQSALVCLRPSLTPAWRENVKWKEQSCIFHKLQQTRVSQHYKWSSLLLFWMVPMFLD